MSHPTQLVSSYSIKKEVYQNSIEKQPFSKKKNALDINSEWQRFLNGSEPSLIEATFIKAKSLMKRR